ncbi:hypothetical protein Efla_005584 [Eimeria flavescens]
MPAASSGMDEAADPPRASVSQPRWSLHAVEEDEMPGSLAGWAESSPALPRAARDWPTMSVAVQMENEWAEPGRLQREEGWVTSEPAAPRHDQAEAEQQLNSAEAKSNSFLQVVFAELFLMVCFYNKFFMAVFCACLPLLIFVGWSASDPRARCLYVIAVMIMGWLSSCMDAYAVSMLPFVLYPGLQVATVNQVAAAYMNPVTFLIVGASMMAAALRRVKLDVAAANWLLRVSPRHPEELALCLMTSCFAVSTCLSNTGTMLIFCPIVDLMIRGLHLEHLRDSRKPAAAEHAAPVASSAADAPPPEGQANEASHEEGQQVVLLMEGGGGDQQQNGRPADRRPSAEAAELSSDLRLAAAMSTPGSSPAESFESELKAEALEEEARVPIGDELDNETPAERKIRNLLFIGCAYAATLGGSATATGSPTNAIFLSVLDAMYAASPGGSASNPVTYTTWLLVFLPISLVQLLFVWNSLCLMWLGPRSAAFAIGRLLLRCFTPLLKVVLTCTRKMRKEEDRSVMPLSEASTSVRTRKSLSAARKAAKKEVAAAKRAADAEAAHTSEHGDGLHMARIYVILAWVLLVCLWLSRRTIIAAVPGWGEKLAGYIDDAWPAMLVPLCLWFIPLYSRRPQATLERPISTLARRWRSRRRVVAEGESVAVAVAQGGGQQERKKKQFESILTFEVLEKEMDWGLLFLLGSGFVIASVSHSTGLDTYLVENMVFMQRISSAAQVACVMAMAALVTQLTSNTATASIFMPLLATIAKGLPGNPLPIMVAANCATTLGFLLPISTAANAVILRFTRIGVWQFFLKGMLPLLLALTIAYGATFTWVSFLFNVVL